jgi:hypothetical protein
MSAAASINARAFRVCEKLNIKKPTFQNLKILFNQKNYPSNSPFLMIQE